MAGAVEERPKPEKGGGGLKVKKHRVGIRIDMTPMVDVAFLLLIFFMVTTVFRLPLAMEVNLPPEDVKIQVAESSVTTLYIDKENSMYYRDGTWPIAPVSWEELPMVLQGTIGLNKEAIILAKISRKAKYDNMVNMMDLFGDLHIERFSVVPMTEDDEKVLEQEKAEQ
jgi:biopolymer transport protein ExbD